MAVSARSTEGTASDLVRPFRFEVAEAQITDLRNRIAATRWPERETVPDDSQGVPLATIQELARYWASDYDWHKCEAKLNARASDHCANSTGDSSSQRQTSATSDRAQRSRDP